jgi:homoserine dehydrogenase
LNIDEWNSKFKLTMGNHQDFGVLNTPEEIFSLCIRHEKSEDIGFAKQRDLSIKLIGHFTVNDQGLTAHVAQQFIRTTEALTSVNFENDAIQFDVDFVHEYFLKGKGAESIPIYSSVLSNLVFLFGNYSYGYFKAS